MTYEEARALIQEHMDYGGSIDSHGLAVAMSSPTEVIVDTAGAKPSEREQFQAWLDKQWENNDSITAYDAWMARAALASPAIGTAGASSDDVRDAARYRWIKENADVTFKESRGFISSASGRLIFSSMPAVQELDSAIDGIIDEEKRESEAKESAK